MSITIKPLINDVNGPPSKPGLVAPPPDSTPEPTPAPAPPPKSEAPSPAAPPTNQESMKGSPIELPKEEGEELQEHRQMVTKANPKKLFGGINRDTSEYIVESLSMLLLAGVTVGEAIESIAAEIQNKQTRMTILEMRTNIDEGMPFSLAIEHTGLFAPSVITLIEVGESTGKLPENLKVIATQMHKNNAMNAKIKSAMLYPAFLVGLLFVVGTGIGVFLLPKLLDIINGLQVEVGPMTKVLIVVGTLFGKFGILFAAMVVLFGVMTMIGIKKSPAIKAFMEEILFRIPGIKKLLFETEISRFGFVLGTLLDAGLPIVTALQSLAASMSTRRYSRFCSELQEKVDEGNSFSKLLSQKKYRKLLPGTICQIVISAEKSGNLSGSLLKIGSNYEDKADLTAHNLETLLEPIVLVLIAIAVLFVALAVFLPIYSLIGNLNGA